MDGEIDGPTLRQLLEDDAAPLIVDIRRREAFEREHIPGSLHVPFGTLPDRIDDVAGADRVVTVCPHGKSSVQAAKLIESYEGTADATVESMAGGLSAWDGPIDSGSDERSEPDEGPAPF